jgi:hypothetical protein
MWIHWLSVMGASFVDDIADTPRDPKTKSGLCQAYVYTPRDPKTNLARNQKAVYQATPRDPKTNLARPENKKRPFRRSFKSASPKETTVSQLNTNGTRKDGAGERQSDRTQAEVEEEESTRTFCLPRAVACARQRVRSPAEGQTGAKRRLLALARGSEDSCEGPGYEKESAHQVCPRERALVCGRFDSTRSVPSRAGRRLSSPRE